MRDITMPTYLNPGWNKLVVKSGCHEITRRVDSSYPASLVTTGRLCESEAFEVIKDLTYKLVKKAYRF